MTKWEVKKLLGRTVYGVINDQGLWYQSRVTLRRYSTRNMNYAAATRNRLNASEKA